MIVLDLRDLTEYAGFRSAVLAAKAEAAAVMLWEFHTPPALGSWTHEKAQEQVELQWNNPTTDMLQAHANEIDATEDAAYAVAMAVADRLGFRVIARVHHGSGADWVLVPKREPANDYYKLEVSGIGRINMERPEARLRAKVDQAQRGDYNRPGIAVVARFEDALILSEGWR